MERLTAGLRATIEARPTNTYLRDHSQNTVKQFFEVPQLLPKKVIELPKNFNGIEVWKDFLTPVLNQGSCGSCWAFASTSCLADKFNIQSQGRYHIQLSPAKLILCDLQGKEIDLKHPEEDTAKVTRINVANIHEYACFGNSLIDAWRYLYLIGTPKEDCIPYNKSLGLGYTPLGEFRDVREVPLCQDISGEIGDMCADYTIDPITGVQSGTPARFYRAIFFYHVPGEDPMNIMEEIYRWGPVTTAMDVYSDFYTFNPKKEIYEWDGKSPKIGGHAICLMGWGEESSDGKKFWWVRNSWGKEWGLNGYFKMIRGKNNCKIEENILTGAPDFFYPEDYLLHRAHEWDVSDKLIAQRENIDISINISGGGINPETGYTRRVMDMRPWMNFAPPVSYKNLPNFKTFIAGVPSRDSGRNSRDSGRDSRDTSRSSSGKERDIYIVVWISLGSLGLVLLLMIVLYIWKRVTNRQKVSFRLNR